MAGASVGLQGSCLHPCGCRFATTDAQGIARFSDLSFGPVSARAVVQGTPGAWDTAVGSATVSSEQVAARRRDPPGRLRQRERNRHEPRRPTCARRLGGAHRPARAVVSGGVCGLQSVTLGTVVHGHRRRVPASTASTWVRCRCALRASSSRASSVASGSIDAAGGDGAAGAAARGHHGGRSRRHRVAAGRRGRRGTRRRGHGERSHSRRHRAHRRAGPLHLRAGAAAGGYLLTARDTRPAGPEASCRRACGCKPSQPAQHDLRLKAKGPVRVTVVDGAGAPVDGAVVHVTTRGERLPVPVLRGDDRRSERAAARVPRGVRGRLLRQRVRQLRPRRSRERSRAARRAWRWTSAVQLTTTGRVSGRFLWADRVTPLPLGTVRLYAGGRLIGQQTTASEGEIGSFAFDYVPAGP